jgi:hypothetical protein
MRNLISRQQFWNELWPVGIQETPRRRVINADKFGLHLNTANKKYGSVPRGLEIRKPGNYDKGNFKLTNLLVVEMGDPAIPNGGIGLVTNPHVWGRVNQLLAPPPKRILHSSSMCSICAMPLQILFYAGH